MPDPEPSPEVPPPLEPDPADEIEAREPSEPTAEPIRSDGLRIVALVPFWATEPPASLSDGAANTVWLARSVPWHPALLARSGRLPTVEPIELSPSPSEGELRLVAAGSPVSAESRAACEGAGVQLLEFDPTADRLAIVNQVLEAIGPGDLDRRPDPEDGIGRDFLALGTAHAVLADLTRAMAHPDGLDRASLEREVLAGALAWASGDDPTAAGRLRAAFELLTQARERFYPVDAYVLDIALIPPNPRPGLLADAFEARVPFSLLGPGRAVETLNEADPATLAAFRMAVDEGWADLIGGPYEEADEPLLPIESVLWQYRRGASAYRSHLDGRTVETLARRRFGLDPIQPRFARGFAIRYGVHLGFDAGRFPVPPQSKRLWEAPDGSSIEALTRPPLAIERASEAARFPWRLAASIRDDHVATVPFLHWAGAGGGPFGDLRRSARYSPVFARWVTLGDYFHLTDRPWDVFRPKLDEYASPYLSQAVARGDLDPISRRVRHAQARARLDALLAIDAIAEALATSDRPASPTDPPVELPSSRFSDLESALEVAEADLETVCGQIEDRLRERAATLVRRIGLEPRRPDDPEPLGGFLVLNPIGVARRASVGLPDAALDLRPTGPLRAAQFTDLGVRGVVDLPGFGFAWVPAANDPAGPPASETARTVNAAGRRLRNESIEVEFDEATGGLRSIRRPGESTPRLAQQLAAIGVKSLDGQPITTRMAADPDGFELEYGGPALARARSRGRLLDPSGRSLAQFQQRAWIWSGRPLLELEIELTDLDPRLRLDARDADPWEVAIVCRWAWPDPESSQNRLSYLRREPTKAARPETPEGFEIAADSRRTLIAFGGLAHHRREGGRMLDTLLVAGREAARTFRMGVGLDLDQPWQSAVEFQSPTVVVPLRGGPPKTGPAGWFLHLDRPSSAVCRVEHAESTLVDGRPGLIFDILETSGRASRCRLRLFRNPTWARQVDFQGDLIVDLTVEGDAVLVDLSPHELARVEVLLGPAPAPASEAPA